MQWLMQNLRGLMKMFVRREVRMRNIAGSRTLARPCDGLARSGGCPARAHDVSVLFFEVLVALADIRTCAWDMEGRKKVAAQAYTCAGGEISRITECALAQNVAGGSSIWRTICLFTFRRLGLSFTVLFQMKFHFCLR